MNHLPKLLLLLALPTASLPLHAQEASSEEAPARSLVVKPDSLQLRTGESARIEAWVEGPDGARLDEELLFYSRSRRSVTVNGEGEVEALQPGTFEIMVSTRRTRSGAGEGQEGRASVGERLRFSVPVEVLPQPLTSLSIASPAAAYTGTRLELALEGTDAAGVSRTVEASWTSSDPTIASLDSFGRLHLRGAGPVKVVAELDGVTAELELEVLANPVASIELEPAAEEARTGDVVRFDVRALDSSGQRLEDVPVELAVIARPDDTLGQKASGQVEPDGRFVAETPGLYTVVATSGSVVGQASLRVEPRGLSGKFELVGHGRVAEGHTSDLWVWEGSDGRDYAVTGTWGHNGDAIFWDVTDPTDLVEIARVGVDARTVNDVKVSPDGTLCVISREGASNRKNGVVLIDVQDPRNPEIISRFDDELTGGVHNLFVTETELYALSAGRRYDILDISDRRSPRRLSTYELDSPSHSIHDVWVEDGLAYSSNWSDGVHIVDVGNGIRGGSPKNPVKVASYAYPSGWNHAAFPYRDEETGRFYVLAGDEAFPYGLNVTGTPTYPRGWIHFIDFTDLDDPQEVARYEVPEAGTHNLWVDGDVLYVAYYNGGLRAVDISGELLGDLYSQGREIAWYLPDDPEGHIPNAPMAWGPQPYKGHVFFSDWNSGLWCVKLVQE